MKKWPPDLWPLAFFGMLHIIPQRDFNFIESELRRVNGDLLVSDYLNRETSEPILPSGTTDSSDDVCKVKKSFDASAKSRKSSHRLRKKRHR